MPCVPWESYKFSGQEIWSFFAKSTSHDPGIAEVPGKALFK